MTKTKYRFSFTGASAVPELTRKVAEVYLQNLDWDKTERDIYKDNLLMKKKSATIKREFRELKLRLSSLSNEEVELLVNGDSSDLQATTMLAILNTYQFIYDFVLEVVRPKYLMFERSLSETDYNKFFTDKSISHPDLERLSPVTQKKIAQVLWKILEQVGFIENVKTKIIIKPYHITLEQLNTFKAPSISRNPIITYVFGLMDYVEEKGFGMKTLRSLNEKFKLPLPEYELQDPFLTLTFPRSLEAVRRVSHHTAITELNNDELLGYEWLKSKGEASKIEYADHFKYDEKKAYRHLSKMRNLKLIVDNGESPKSNNYKYVCKS